MAEILNAGYTLQYLWEMRARLAEQAHFDLDAARRTLSTFHLERLTPGSDDAHPALSAIERHIVAVYGELLQRGLPTLAPLLVERTLLDGVRHIISVGESLTGTGSFRFDDSMASDVMRTWQDALISAHLPIDPRLDPAQRDRAVFTASDAEAYFYDHILPQAVGPAVTLLLEPQRSLPSLLPDAAIREFWDQRVDFALEAGPLRHVYEIDGAQHASPVQRTHDQGRDRALQQQGWKVSRIKTGDLRAPETVEQLRRDLPDGPFAQRARTLYEEPLWCDEFSLAAQQIVLAPFAIARIQRVLLRAIETGGLRLDARVWRIAVVQRDVRCAALAVADLLEHLDALYELWNWDRSLPSVDLRLYYSAEFAQLTPQLGAERKRRLGLRISERRITADGAEPFAGDLLIDLAMLQPPGFDQMEDAHVKHNLAGAGAAYEVRSALFPVDARRLSGCTPMAYPVTEQTGPALAFFLRDVFRKAEFRPGQQEVIHRALTLKPVIGLLPTGAGKSLCYQLSTLLQPGMALVVVPLNSLMTDQVDNLRDKLAIDWIGHINAQLDGPAKQRVLDQVRHGELRFVVVAPERLQSQEFRSCLSDLTRVYPVAYAVIDEAHCVSEWGHDFRTSYLKLASTIREQCMVAGRSPTTIALTGTASYAVLSDVQREIGIDDESAKVFPPTFDRQELRFGIVKVPTSRKAEELAKLVDSLPTRFGIDHETFFTPKPNEEAYAGIVFVPHTNGAFGIEVRDGLEHHLKCKVEFYSGQTPRGQKEAEYTKRKLAVQRDFNQDRFTVLVATKAFGMGVDKPNVRFTIHYNISQSLEAFYQEAGRAGRDRRPAECWIVFSDDQPKVVDRAFEANIRPEEIKRLINGRNRGDAERMLYLQQRSYPGREEEIRVLRTVLTDCIWPALGGKLPNEPVHLIVPFRGQSMIEDEAAETDTNTSETEAMRDKALYRLSLLGVVDDYTKDYRAELFEVTAVRLPDEAYLNRLHTYISRYRTRERADRIVDEIDAEPGDTVLDKCITYLLGFVYTEIERKRRVAIQSMVDVARRAAAHPDDANDVIRRELLAYLEESHFTDPLSRLARRIAPEEWLALLEVKDERGIGFLHSVDGVRQLLGGCRRTLESYPDHPGLLFVSSLARLLLAEPETELALEESRRAFAGLALLTEAQRVEMIPRLLWAYRRWLRSTRGFEQVQTQIMRQVLALYPIRELARQCYDVSPAVCQNWLLNQTLVCVRQLAKRLCN